MTDLPLAKFEEGRLWLDQGFPDYYPASRFSVVMKREIMLSLSGPDAARKAGQCQQALDAWAEYQTANSGQRETG